MNSMKTLLFLALSAVALLGCSAATNSNQAPDSTTAPEVSEMTNSPSSNNAATANTPAVAKSDSECVAGLPFSRGASFCSLDEYLAHLEIQGAIDLPWWREVRPGIYEQVVRMPGAQRETATREELMQRFGFRR